MDENSANATGGFAGPPKSCLLHFYFLRVSGKEPRGICSPAGQALRILLVPPPGAGPRAVSGGLGPGGPRCKPREAQEAGAGLLGNFVRKTGSLFFSSLFFFPL